MKRCCARANAFIAWCRAEIGIDPDEVSATLEPPLSTWFSAYRTHRPADLPEQVYPRNRAGIVDDGRGEGRGEGRM